jgi:DNA ligase-1
MLLERVVAASKAVSATRSRLKKAAALGECLRAMEPSERPLGVSYLIGELPQGKIGVGRSALGVARDVPAAAEASLSLRDVDDAASAIAAISGAGSTARRKRALADVFGRATAAEQECLVRLIAGALRQGALAGLMVDAVARATELDIVDVRRAYMVSGDLGAVAAAAMNEGGAGLDRFRLELFRPILPMLAQPADDVAAVFERMDTAAFELKLDGARIQVHKDGDDVRVFSRRLNDVTAAVPEVVEAARAMTARSLILDGEVVAMRADGTPHTFQTTMRRFGRRLDVADMRRQLPLTGMFFDVLSLDGASYIERPGTERIAAMGAVVPVELQMPRIVTADEAEADAFWRDALTRGHEGVMAKSLDATYDAGGRGKTWLKLKPAHTLDLVVLAVEWGSGRRKGWLSNIHLGARDPSTGGFIMLGKTFKGMTDEMLAWQTKRFSELEISRDEWTVYVEPVQVVEVAFNDVQSSSHYPGGLALRFARVKRYRDDKRAEDADTIDAVRALHRE